MAKKKKTTKKKTSASGAVLRRRATLAGIARKQLKLPACIIFLTDDFLEKLRDESLSLVNGTAYFYKLIPRATRAKTISYIRRVRASLKKIK